MFTEVHSSGLNQRMNCKYLAKAPQYYIEVLCLYVTFINSVVKFEFF